jgi:hypothetical protein
VFVIVRVALAAATRLEHRSAVLRPAWAMISAGNLARPPVLDGVEHLIILVDHDASGTGQESADACAERCVVAGRIVTRLVPDQVDTDFNDVVLWRPRL